MPSFSTALLSLVCGARGSDGLNLVKNPHAMDKMRTISAILPILSVWRTITLKNEHYSFFTLAFLGCLRLPSMDRVYFNDFPLVDCKPIKRLTVCDCL